MYPPYGFRIEVESTKSHVVMTGVKIELRPVLAKFKANLSFHASVILLSGI